MIRFECDYLEGACPEVLHALIRTNLEQTEGYGTDEYCDRARARIKAVCGAPDADVHFLVGGTQANTTLISAALRPWQAAVGADTAHIATHESMAIEAAGHKVITLPGHDGKITGAQVETLMRAHLASPTWEHVPQPGLVYISQPTEYGTLYSLDELKDLRRVCQKYSLYLYADGARLIYALTCPENDVKLSDLSRLTDAFYIGGTKCGTLFGEAMVINTPALNECFRVMIKQHGGLLAKGRLLGLQFDALFNNDVYLNISRHAIHEAARIRDALTALDVEFAVASPTNQLFPVLPDEVLRRLSEKYSFSAWERKDKTHSVIRICTSWATQPENTDRLIADIKRILTK